MTQGFVGSVVLLLFVLQGFGLGFGVGGGSGVGSFWFGFQGLGVCLPGFFLQLKHPSKEDYLQMVF